MLTWVPAECDQTLAEALANIPSNTTRQSFRWKDFYIIPDYAFTNFPYLTSLSLSNNKILRLESEAFHGLANLEHLHLAHNKISNLLPDIFWGVGLNSSRLSIDLSNNYICTLPAQLFEISPPFQSIRINDNKISCLPEGIFSNVVLLQYPSGGIFMDDNLISHVSAEILQVAAASDIGFGSINLSQNKISNLPANLTSLMAPFKKLFLSSNLIEFIHPQAFAPDRPSEKLYLSNNRLTCLPDAIQHLPISVSHSRNPLTTVAPDCPLPSSIPSPITCPSQCLIIHQYLCN